MNRLGWSAGAVVLAGILTAWMEPSTGPLLHAAVLLLMLPLMALCALRRECPPLHWLVLLPAGFAVWAAAQVWTGVSVYDFATWNSAAAWLARAAVFTVAYAGFRASPDRRRLLSLAIWFGGVFSTVALAQWYAGGGKVLGLFATRYKDGVAATFLNRDHYAALIELLLPVALAAALEARRLPLGIAVCAGAMFASVVAVGSRAGALIVSLEAVALLTVAAVRRQHERSLLIAGGLALCVAAGGWSLLWERLAAQDPFASRREMLIATVEMIKARPWTGFGLGTWPSVYPAFAVFDPPGVFMNHAHNDWAELASEGGPAAVLLLGAFALAMAGRLRSRLWALGIPAVLAHALVDFPLQKEPLALAVFFLAGVAAEPSRRGPPESRAAGGDGASQTSSSI